jgi:hypothetical protein
MPEYAQSFAEDRSDFCVLSDLTDQHLKDVCVVLGDHPLKQRRGIILVPGTPGSLI